MQLTLLSITGNKKQITRFQLQKVFIIINNGKLQQATRFQPQQAFIPINLGQ